MLSRRGFLAWTGAAGLLPLREVLALEAGQPSATARGAAVQRAVHQLLETPRIFEDPLALRVVGAQGVRRLGQDLDRFRTPASRAMRALIVARSRFAEDELARAASAGVRQYVVLGAGLDTFGHRNPHRGLRVFEVDHPDTQRWKRARLSEQGIDVPRSLGYVPVDFERERLEDKLEAAGFRAESPAFFSWLGVVIYLTPEAMAATLRTIGSCAKGSRLVFDFAPPVAALGEAERRGHDALAERVARAGERWIGYYDPDSLAEGMRARGFVSARHLGADEINERYFAGRVDGFRLYGSARMMTAQV